MHIDIHNHIRIHTYIHAYVHVLSARSSWASCLRQSTASTEPLGHLTISHREPGAWCVAISCIYIYNVVTAGDISGMYALIFGTIFGIMFYTHGF